MPLFLAKGCLLINLFVIQLVDTFEFTESSSTDNEHIQESFAINTYVLLHWKLQVVLEKSYSEEIKTLYLFHVFYNLKVKFVQ